MQTHERQLTHPHDMPNDITIKIVMTAPSRVGKTSLLAAMAAQIDQEVKEFGFRLLADTTSARLELQESRKKLEHMATGPGMTTDITLGPDPSLEKREFPFTLSKPGYPGIPKLHLRFVDLPGGWYTGKGETETADEMLNEAHVVLLAVDAVALMEDRGLYDTKVNMPELICDGILSACNKRSEPPLVLIVAVKAETYLQEKSAKGTSCKGKPGEQELRTMLCEKYKSLGVVRKGGGEVKGCAVETVGNIIFNDLLEGERGFPIVRFRRIKGGYNPRYCSVPILLIMKKILRIADSEIGPSSIWDNVMETFGFPSDRSVAKKEITSVLTAITEKSADGRKLDQLVFDV